MKYIYLLTFLFVVQLVNAQDENSPISMFIEDKEFEAGEEVTFDVWSDDVEHLIGWQFRLNFVNATMTDLTEGEMFDDIPHNIFNDGLTINSLWIPASATALDIATDGSWFTLTIIPEIDGSTGDIFTTTNDPWSEILIEDQETIIGFPADFAFNVAERNILSSNEEVVFSSIKILGNPVADILVLGGLDDIGNKSLTIYDMTGQVMISQKLNGSHTSEKVDVSALYSGVYTITISVDNSQQSLRFVKQ